MNTPNSTSETKHFKCLGIVPSHHIRSVYSISWKDNLIATAGADNRLNVVQLDELSEKFNFKVLAQKNMAHQSDINCVEFGPKHNGR